MPSTIDHLVTLIPHACGGSMPVQRVSARVRRENNGRLLLGYSIEGSLDRLLVPPPSRSRIVPTLWQHTCCECFVACNGSSRYHEFNFSPSGEWAAYAFSKYREGILLAEERMDPHITVRLSDHVIELDAVVLLDRLSEQHRDTTLSLAISAVLESDDGTHSYWALNHPPGQPDFHHPSAFALQIR